MCERGSTDMDIISCLRSDVNMEFVRSSHYGPFPVPVECRTGKGLRMDDAHYTATLITTFLTGDDLPAANLGACPSSGYSTASWPAHK